MSLDVTALRTSFDLVVERSPDVVHKFYDILFARYPQARPLFSRKSRDKQEEMLTQALGRGWWNTSRTLPGSSRS
jgi:hemoglobin-like flavoprotein